MQKVQFYYSHVRFPFTERNKVKRVVERIFSSEGYALEKLNYIFCSDKQLLEMNIEWLDHDTYTDIISFDLSDAKGPIKGEIYISTDRVRENAFVFGAPFQEELRRVIFHGALHLCGYKDKTKAQQLKIRSVEDKWLQSFARST